MDPRLHDVTPHPDAALLFDMDGLLIDTEPLYIRAAEEVLAPLGRGIAIEVYQSWIGRHVSDEEIAAAAGLPLPVDDIRQATSRRLRELFATDLRRMPGVAEFLAGAAAPYRRAVASSSSRELIRSCLTSVGLLDRFDLYVSAREVERGKPAPDVFLEAARRLGADPARCVVFEDSPHGIAAARAAGMRAVAVLTPLTRHFDLSAADLVVERIDEVSAAWLGTPA